MIQRRRGTALTIVKRNDQTKNGYKQRHLFLRKHVVLTAFSLCYIFQICKPFMEMGMARSNPFDHGIYDAFVGGKGPPIESTTESDLESAFNFMPLAAAVSNHSLKPPIVREAFDNCRDFTFKEVSLFNSCRETDVGSASIKLQMERIRSDIASLSNGKVLIMTNAVCLGSTVRPSDITITNQFSVEKLERFLVQVQRWNGPVSSALYIRHIKDLLKFQSFLLKNLESLRQVSFHLYFDNSRSHSAHPYPNNVLRNLALDNVKTNYFLLMDIDLFTTPGRTHDGIQSLLRDDGTIVDKMNSKTMFVLPAFEHTKVIPDSRLSADYWSFPMNKKDVKKMYEDDVTPQFKASNDNGHGSSNYTKWISNQTDASYPINFKFGFEPYVMGAKKSIPRFYDFFRGYGFNKLSWFTELHLAGYKYEVLRDYFVFHANHVPSYDGTDKRHQLKQNAVCAKGFIDGLVDSYGDVADEVLYEWKSTYRKEGSTFGIFGHFGIFAYFGII